MDDSSNDLGFAPPEAVSSVATPSSSDPISSLFGGFAFIIILILLIVLVGLMMVGSGVGWLARTVTGGPKEGFQTGPRPRAEYDAQCADFPDL